MAKNVGRVELLMWANELLQLNYTKVEEAGSGVAYCQILDSIYGDIPLNKLKYDAKQEHEYIGNYKILQLCFDRHKIRKEIPVNKLIKKRFQDNFEFLVFLKAYWEENFPGGTYDAKALREEARPSSRMFSPKINMTSISNVPYGRSKPVSPHFFNRSTHLITPKKNNRTHKILSPNNNDFGGSPLLQRTQTNVAELMRSVARIEGERDYYYTKLREVESLYNEVISLDNPDVRYVLERLQTVLFSQETASERAGHSPETSHDADILPNMLGQLEIETSPIILDEHFEPSETF